jgi:hypothetical protein
MKKNIILFGALSLVASVTILDSCKKKTYTNTDQLATLSNATVTGYAFARLVDTIGAADSQYAPSGTVITAWIDSKDLLAYTDSTTPVTPYARKYYTGSVGANGKYNITVDVSLYRNATVHIEPQAFSYNHVRKSISAPFGVITVNKKYAVDAITTSVEKNETDTVNLYYIGK